MLDQARYGRPTPKGGGQVAGWLNANFLRSRVALGSTAQTEDRYLRSFAPGYGCRDVPDEGKLPNRSGLWLKLVSQLASFCTARSWNAPNYSKGNKTEWFHLVLWVLALPAKCANTQNRMESDDQPASPIWST